GEHVEHRLWGTERRYVRALIDAHLGRVEAARAEAKKGLSVATTAQDPWFVMLLSGVLGFAELTGGNPEQAEASLARAGDLSDRTCLRGPVFPVHAHPTQAGVGPRR